jgi:hypothetical protein
LGGGGCTRAVPVWACLAGYCGLGAVLCVLNGILGAAHLVPHRAEPAETKQSVCFSNGPRHLRHSGTIARTRQALVGQLRLCNMRGARRAFQRRRHRRRARFVIDVYTPVFRGKEGFLLGLLWRFGLVRPACSLCRLRRFDAFGLPRRAAPNRCLHACGSHILLGFGGLCRCRCRLLLRFGLRSIRFPLGTTPHPRLNRGGRPFLRRHR